MCSVQTRFLKSKMEMYIIVIPEPECNKVMVLIYWLMW